MTIKLDFEKIKFQNSSISLISLGKLAKCLIFFARNGQRPIFSAISNLFVFAHGCLGVHP